MFKRQNPRPLLRAGCNYIWPEMGWKRFFAYTKKRIIRLSDSPHRIAMGLAFGVAASFSPYIGTHIIQACALSYLFRGNIIAGALGTIIGNPSTFPFFWWLSIVVGNVILGWFGVEGTIISQDTNFVALFKTAFSEPVHLLLPWTLGGYIIAILIFPISYAIFYPIIKAAKLARAKLITRKRKARAS